MRLCKWDDLPLEMQTEEVAKYYDILKKRGAALVLKRAFDIFVSSVMLLLFSPLFLILAIAIKLDSKGPVFYRQERVTQFNKRFKIHKFRSMKVGSDKGSLVTVDHDDRITRVGKFIRKTRLDEISQLIDVFTGNMTFVGTRPEVPRYVERYSPEMMATLLLPAGVTSEASIYFKDEAELIKDVDNADDVYVEKVLPIKMYYNLRAIRNFGFFKDIGVMIKTVLAVLGKNYAEKDELPEKDGDIS